MDYDSDSPFYKLPTELMLKILLQVDPLTLLKAIPLVDKDFNQLSKIPDLYERYELDSYDTWGRKMRWILSQPLYKEHLKVLKTDSSSLYHFDKLSFKSLRTLIVDFKDGCMLPSNITQFLQNTPDDPPVDIKIQGRLILYSSHIKPNLDHLISDIETVVIKTAERFNNLLELQARKCLVKVDLSTDIETPLENVIERLQEDKCLRDCSIGLILKDRYIPQKYLNAQYTDLFATRVVRLELGVCDADERQLLEIVCRKWVALRELLLTVERADYLTKHSDFERPLDLLHIRQRLKCLCLGPLLGKLVSEVQSSLSLDRCCLDDIDLHRNLKTAVFCNSELNCKTLFRLLHSVESVELVQCKITDNLQQYSSPAYLQEFPSRLKSLNIRFIEDDEILGIIPHLRYSETFEKLYITTKGGTQSLDINQMLDGLLHCQHQLHVFEYNGQPTGVMHEQTFELLRRFKKLKYFYAKRVEISIPSERVREYIGNAITIASPVTRKNKGPVCYTIDIFF